MKHARVQVQPVGSQTGSLKRRLPVVLGARKIAGNCHLWHIEWGGYSGMQSGLGLSGSRCSITVEEWFATSMRFLAMVLSARSNRCRFRRGLGCI